MIDYIFQFPKKSEVARIVPKGKVFDNTDVSKSTKEAFSNVSKVVWENKLSASTVNLPEKGWIQEIQIFSVHFKNYVNVNEILKTIDQAIHHPIVFQIIYDGKIKYAAAFKRQSEADSAKWVTSEYFESGWIDNNAERRQLPVVLNLESLYYEVLKFLMPVSLREKESIGELAQRLGTLRIKNKEAEVLSGKLHREKQFNRQIEINKQLKRLKSEIEELER